MSESNSTASSDTFIRARSSSSVSDIVRKVRASMVYDSKVSGSENKCPPLFKELDEDECLIVWYWGYNEERLRIAVFNYLSMNFEPKDIQYVDLMETNVDLDKLARHRVLMISELTRAKESRDRLYDLLYSMHEINQNESKEEEMTYIIISSIHSPPKYYDGMRMMFVMNNCCIRHIAS